MCRKALVLGYGRSGRAAEKLLLAEGVDVYVMDERTSGLAALQELLRGHSFDLSVVSPGFALDHSWLSVLRAAGVPLLSELELGWSRHKGRTVAVTGSNGKSTAVKWIAESLKAAGLKAEIGGNYGIPACEVVLESAGLDWLVLEVSSFQLEIVSAFRADVAVLLNVLPNHLNRHGTMEVYRKTKARLFEHSDVCIVPAELLNVIRADVPEAAGRWLTFGDEGADFVYNGGQIIHRGEVALDLSGTMFDNAVLGGCTGAAVAAVMQACGVLGSFAEKVARCFEPLPHRLQKVAEIDGVVYVNDSKATNLAAMRAALQACGKGVHLIAGGQPKESDYTFIKEVLAEHTKRIYLIGQASRAMYQAWNGVSPCVECGSLEKALECARTTANEGDFILLSPGCASFDQFNSFEHRGEQFVKLVLG